jgi:hypothetical protein
MAQMPFLECGVYGSSTAGLRNATPAFALSVNGHVDENCISLAIDPSAEHGMSDSSANDDGDAGCSSADE